MNFRTKWVGIALVAFLSGGCGTVNNTREIHVSEVYGGVRHDWATLKGMDWKDKYWHNNLLFLPLYVVDLPLSAIGDTVTLPLVIDSKLTRLRQAPGKSEAAKGLSEVPPP